MRRIKAREFAGEIATVIAEIEAAGITSANAVAAQLNRRGYRAPRGGEWRAQQVIGSAKPETPRNTPADESGFF